MGGSGVGVADVVRVVAAEHDSARPVGDFVVDVGEAFVDDFLAFVWVLGALAEVGPVDGCEDVVPTAAPCEVFGGLDELAEAHERVAEEDVEVDAVVFAGGVHGGAGGYCHVIWFRAVPAWGCDVRSCVRAWRNSAC